MSARDDAIRGTLDALNRVFVTNSRDWAANRTEAWLWGVIVGWDNDGGNEALDQLADRFGWNEAAVAQLRAERAGFAQIEQLLTEVAELRTLAEAASTSGVTRDEAAKLGVELKRTDNKQRRTERYLRQAEAEAAESHAEAKQLEARMATMEAVQARHRATWYEERDGLLAKVEDALALCREIRPDSVLGTSPQVRLKLIEDRLTMPVGGSDAH